MTNESTEPSVEREWLDEDTWLSIPRYMQEHIHRAHLAALSQPATSRDAVAYRYQLKDLDPILLTTKRDWAINHPDWVETPLYDTPAPAAGVEELVAALEECEPFIQHSLTCQKGAYFNCTCGTDQARDTLQAALRAAQVRGSGS